MLLEAARFSNNSKFCLALVLNRLRRQIKNIAITTSPRTKVPKAASRIISFLDSSIGMRLFSVGNSVVDSVVSLVVSLVVNLVVGSVDVTSLVVFSTSVEVFVVSNSVCVKKFIFRSGSNKIDALVMSEWKRCQRSNPCVGGVLGCQEFPPLYNPLSSYSHSR